MKRVPLAFVTNAGDRRREYRRHRFPVGQGRLGGSPQERFAHRFHGRLTLLFALREGLRVAAAVRRGRLALDTVG